MKNIILTVLLIFNLTTYCQKTSKKTKVIIISQKVIKKKGVQLVLKNGTEDSRCPEGTECIWAGEVTVVVSVYKANKLIAEKSINLSTKNNNDNFEWFANNLGINKSRIKFIQLAPYPKDGVVLNPKDYIVKVNCSKQI
jgi:hypothetical protein